MTWLSGGECQKGSYRITLLGVWTDMPTSQTMSITISIPVISIMENTFYNTNLQFRWCLCNLTSRLFIWFIVLGLQGGESLSHQEMIQCFPGWGLVWIPTSSWLLHIFLHVWSVLTAESSVKGLLALVLIFATGTICQTAVMMSIKERCQPPTQSLHVADYHRMLCFGARAAGIICVCAIQRGLHLVLLTVQSGSMQLYLSNTNNLIIVNLVYMIIILFNAWCNHCCDI